MFMCIFAESDSSGVSPGVEVQPHTYGPVAPSATDLQVSKVRAGPEDV